MFGKLKQEDIDQLLGTQLVGRIGCHGDGVTYVVPISYAFDGNYIYAHSFNGLKLAIMRKNPKVCFEVDDMQNLANWQSAICWGEFEELTGEVEKRVALQKLNDRVLPILSSETMHISPEWPFPSQDCQKIKGIFFRIRLTEKTGRFERSEGDSFFAT